MYEHQRIAKMLEEIGFKPVSYAGKQWDKAVCKNISAYRRIVPLDPFTTACTSMSLYVTTGTNQGYPIKLLGDNLEGPWELDWRGLSIEEMRENILSILNEQR